MALDRAERGSLTRTSSRQVCYSRFALRAFAGIGENPTLTPSVTMKVETQPIANFRRDHIVGVKDSRNQRGTHPRATC
jgi:hypothetical protein